MKLIFSSKELPRIAINTNGRISSAIEVYKKKNASMKTLLEHYLIAKKHGDDLNVIDPYKDVFRRYTGHEIEGGISPNELFFERYAVSIKDELPTDVINSAFYSNKYRNDYAFELGYLLPLFIDVVSKNENVLIINPSPFMISRFEEAGCICGKKTYAVTDETVAELYKTQFPASEFITFKQLTEINGIDAVLIVNRDQKESLSTTLLKCLSRCCSQTKVIALIPRIWFDKANSNANVLRENGFSIKQILMVDSSATTSIPRKKMLVVLENGYEDSIETFQSAYDDKTSTFTVLSESVLVDEELYLETNKSILSLWKEAVLPNKDKSEPCYNSAERYEFSKEISLFYRIYSERRNSYAGVAYYKEIKDREFGTWGKKLSKDIEKGLRAETLAEVIQAIEEIVFEDNLYLVIRSDIEAKYITYGIPLTMKTVWFFCWNSLVNSNAYDHGFMSRLFRLSSVANIIPQMKSAEAILEGIACVLNCEIEDIPYKYVYMVYSMLKKAFDLKLIQYNPLESYLRIYTQRTTERTQEIRNALVKKSLSESQELSIFQAIIGTSNKCSQYACVENSLLLATGIRLFTGITIREVAALNWSDFRLISGTNNYQLLIYKIVNKDGEVIYFSGKHMNSFRLVPSPEVLTKLLLARKQHLVNSGIEEKYLEDCPIVLGEERMVDMKAKRTVRHCKPQIISKCGKQVIELANIPENNVILPDGEKDIVTDFNKYHGDIFRSNYQYKAINVAYLDKGEIAYVMGIDAPDTFSRHYCDFSNDNIQKGIIQKLRRWELEYERILTKEKLSIPQFGHAMTKTSFIVGPFEDGTASLELIIDNYSGSVANVTVSCTHGLVANAQFYGVKDDEDNSK